MSALRGEQGRVTAKLNRVAKSLFVVNKNSFAFDRFMAEPVRLAELSWCSR
jgi:hypothetical protein